MTQEEQDEIVKGLQIALQEIRVTSKWARPQERCNSYGKKWVPKSDKLHLPLMELLNYHLPLASIGISWLFVRGEFGFVQGASLFKIFQEKKGEKNHFKPNNLGV